MKTNNVIDIIVKTVHENNLISKKDMIIVGVSGGSDSVCLLLFLNLYKKEWNLNIKAVHINHKLRGEESDSDEAYVKSLCRQLKIPLICRTVDIKKEAKKRRLSLEETAREVRYEIFEEVLNASNAQKIAVAHNQDDLVETVLMNIFRGAGLKGLAGIQYKQGKIIRPLLDLDKKQIEEWLKIQGIEYRTDSSNLEPVFTRNKIRLELIPQINNILQVKINEPISRMAKLIKKDDEYLETLSEKIYKRIVNKKNENTLEINVEALKKLHVSMESRIYRRCYLFLTGTMKDLEQIHIEKIRNFLKNSKTGKEIHLPRNIIIVKGYEKLIVVKKLKPLKVNKELKVPGKNIIKQFRIEIDTSLININQYNNEIRSFNEKENRNTQYFDYCSFKLGICIRSRLAGDIIKPYKAPGTKSLKDYFIDAKIPRYERDRIPLIADGRNVVWILGYRTHGDYKVKKTTKRILKISYKKIENGGHF